MKYLIFLPLLLTGCFGPTNCPPLNYSGFKYGDRVMVHGGFYDLQSGTVRAQQVIYTGMDACNEAGFKVKLDNGGEEVTIEKSQLKRLAFELKCKNGAHPFCKLPQ